MGSDISPGGVLTDGTLVHDADFNALVGEATLLPTAISARALKPELSLGDEILINAEGTLKKVTGQQIVTATTVPTGCMMDFAGATEPLGWVFCYGQALSRTTYAALFEVIGVVYGAGDGSTTFAVPDCRGRVAAGQDDMGGTSAARLSAYMAGATLGAAGGNEGHALTEAQLASHAHYVPVSVYGQGNFGGSGSCQVNADHLWPGAGGQVRADGGNYGGIQGVIFYGSCNVTTFVGFTSTGGGASDYRGSSHGHPNVQPTIILNKIIKT